MMTVSMLARQCGLSRTTLLYYESQGLLRRPPRTAGNYRAYADQDVQRIQQIGLLRKVGLSVAEIRSLLVRQGGGRQPFWSTGSSPSTRRSSTFATTSGIFCAC